MPIIKSAKKRMRQSLKRRALRLPYKTRMKTAFKKVLEMAKEGNQEACEKALKEAYSLIDTACKKHLLQKNTAARRKSRLAKAVNGMSEKKA